VGQEALGGCCKRVGRVGVGWGVNKVEGGKGFTCALFRDIGKLLGWGFTFPQSARGW